MKSGPGKHMYCICSYIIIIIIAIFFLIPIFVLFVHAFFNDRGGISLIHFKSVLTKPRTIQAFKIGLLVSSCASGISIFFSIMVSLALSKRTDYISNKIVSTVLLLGGMPFSTLVIPLYFVLYSFKLLDSLPITMFFLASVHLPENILLLESTTADFPREFKESTLIDGASFVTYVRKILIPQLSPVLTGAFITTFINCWGNFIVPFILLSASNKMPVAVAFFQSFSGSESASMSYLSSYAILYYLPVVILFVLLRLGLTKLFVLNRFKN